MASDRDRVALHAGDRQRHEHIQANNNIYRRELGNLLGVLQGSDALSGHKYTVRVARGEVDVIQPSGEVFIGVLVLTLVHVS